MTLRVRAKLACDIAGIDRDRFNEAVAAGIYPCAPPTRAGSARVFEEPDLVALYIYGFLMRHGMNGEEAARHGCAVGEQVRQAQQAGETAGRVYWVKSLGPSWVLREKNANPDANNVSGSPLIMSLAFHTENILDIVRKAVAEHDAIKGEE